MGYIGDKKASLKVATDKLIPPAFIPHLANRTAIQIYFGGAGSGKSSFIARRTILDLMAGKRNFLIVRKVYGYIKDSFYAELKKAVSSMGLSKYFRFKVSPLEVTCTLNNRKCVFRGMDDPEKIKSITVENGIITDLIMEEATEFTEADYDMLDTRLRGECDVVKRETFLFNPVFLEHWIYKRFFYGHFGDCDKEVRYSIDVSFMDYTKEEPEHVTFQQEIFIHKSTHWDNPYLSPQDRVRYESYKTTSPYMYDVYTCGNWGSLGDKIFSGYTILDRYEDIDTSSWRWYAGGDAGFSDPCTLVLCKYNPKSREVLVVDSCGGAGLLPAQFAQQCFSLLEKWGLPKNHPITFDNNEPRLISQLQTEKLNVVRAKKGMGSVYPSYLWLMTHTIFVLRNSGGILSDIKNAEWKKKDGASTDEPVHRWTHYLDGWRYSLENFWTMTGRVIGRGGLYG